MAASAVQHTFSESGILFFLIFVSAFLFIYTYGRNFFRSVKLASAIPGPSGMQVFKTSFKTIGASPHEIFKIALELRTGLDDILKIWLGHRLVIFLYNPADIEVILSSSVHIDKSKEYSVFKPWFGNGLLISTGDMWKMHRKMIAPTFHMSILKNFMPTFNTNSLKVVEKMRKENGKTFDCHEYMSGTTVDILLETAMGYQEPRSEETGYNYAMAVMKLCEILHKRHYKIWLNPEYLFQKTKMALDHSKLLGVIKGLTGKVVRSKKREHLKKSKDDDSFVNVNYTSTEDVIKEKSESITGYNMGTAVRDDLDDDDDIGEKKRMALLDSLTQAALQENVNFSDQDAMDQVNTIMFEGHDTTAAGSSFALCMLGIHQDIQDKVMEEIEGIFQGSDRPCSFADTLEMKYLERVMMETLRMYPPVPVIARETREEVKLASGDYTIPIGATIVIAQYILHRREKSFPNPHVFNPDNFLPEKCSERHYYSYIPFSAGPRSCVGRKYAMLKLKVLLSTILRNYRVHTDLTEDHFKLQADIILKMTDGFNIRLEEKKRVAA